MAPFTFTYRNRRELTVLPSGSGYPLLVRASSETINETTTTRTWKFDIGHRSYRVQIQERIK